MKRFKIIFTLLLVLIISGCTVNYNVTIDKNGKVKESISALEYNEYLGDTKSNIQNNIYAKYSNYEQIISFKEYEMDSIHEKNKTGVKVSKSFNSICDYVNYNATSLYIFSSMKCTEKKGTIKIENDGKFLGGCMECNDEANTIDILTITFKLPDKAISSNADRVSENKYIWNINRADTQEKDFLLVINKDSLTTKKQNYSKTLIYIILLVIGIPAIYIGYKVIKSRKNIY